MHISIFVAFQVIRLSHRVAGPVFRLTHQVLEMAAGKYSRSIIVRKNDYPKELAEALSLLSRGLEERRQAFLGEIEALQGVVSEGTACPGSDTHPAVSQGHLERILRHIQTLKDIMAQKGGQDGEGKPAAGGEAKKAPSETTPVACSRT